MYEQPESSDPCVDNRDKLRMSTLRVPYQPHHQILCRNVEDAGEHFPHRGLRAHSP
jgi:hypothetical protein